MASSVIITGDKELIKLINDIAVKGDSAIKRVVKQKSIDVERDYKQGLRSNGNYKTGDLEKSIDHVISNNGKTGTIGSDSIISKYIEFGTSPHKIRIKNAKVLSDGVDIFGTEVNHPGYKGNPALRRSYYKNIGINERKIVNALIKEFEKIK